MSYGCKNRIVSDGRWVQDGWMAGNVDGVDTLVPNIIWLKNPWGRNPPCGHTYRRESDPGCEGCLMR